MTYSLNKIEILQEKSRKPIIHPNNKAIATEVLDEHYLSIFYEKSILLKIRYKIRRLTKWLK
jgi:hypothetical protein